MTGADYVDEKITLPLRWLLIVVTLAGLPLVWMRKYKKTAILVMSFFILQLGLPGIVHAVYVRRTRFRSSGRISNVTFRRLRLPFGLNRQLHGTSVCASFRAGGGRSRSGCHAARQCSPLGPACLQRNDRADPSAAPLLHVSRKPTWTATFPMAASSKCFCLARDRC